MGRSILKLVLFVCGLMVIGNAFSYDVLAGVNDFYFSDFTGDYYLSKDSEGISHLKVKESVTAVFPDYNQNKGICRQIPFTNQAGNNITLPTLTRSNLKLTRNGVPEAIYSISKGSDYYEVCTGTEEYVLGEQTYVFEYEFEKVVTEYDGAALSTTGNTSSTHQELYWDTNGNGATQKFNSVTARLHFADDVMSDYTGNAWCYVGKYGENGQERCQISKIADGVEFSAKNLESFENLTFDVELKPGSFKVPGPIEDYIYLFMLTALVGLCLVAIVMTVSKTAKWRSVSKEYSAIFTKPEYQPNREYSLNEMSEIYLGKKKSPEVAMLLELIVGRKVELLKNEKKKWNIFVKEDTSAEYEDLLSILNNGTRPEVGDTIALMRHTATSSLMKLKKKMETRTLNRLKSDKLVNDNYKMGSSRHRGLSSIIGNFIAVLFYMGIVALFIMGMISDWLDLSSTPGRVMVFEEEFFLLSPLLIIATVLICVIIYSRVAKFKNYTDKGLKASKYMEGLRLYIEMAEADRMKLLQSVKGADVSAKGIVKLYEKLLPYAAVFGLEESWMDEMKEYCEVEEIETPDYLTTGYAISEITRSLHSAAAYASSSTTMGSSGGGSSSGFSGGGGGGFSGGGGGGGGFSGR